MLGNIEQNVTLPKISKNASKYPWAEMQIGESFLYHENKRPNCCYWGLKTGYRFTMRTEGNRMRVWRVE